MIVQILGLQPINFTNEKNETITGINLYGGFKDENVQGICSKKWFLKQGMLPKDIKINDKINISFNHKGKIEMIDKVN